MTIRKFQATTSIIDNNFASSADNGCARCHVDATRQSHPHSLLVSKNSSNARPRCFAALVWRLQRAEGRYGSVSISLFLPRTCPPGNGTLIHPRHRHQLALVLVRSAVVPQACPWHAKDATQVEGHRLDGCVGCGLTASV